MILQVIQKRGYVYFDCTRFASMFYFWKESDINYSLRFEACFVVLFYFEVYVFINLFLKLKKCMHLNQSFQFILTSALARLKLE